MVRLWYANMRHRAPDPRLAGWGAGVFPASGTLVLITTCLLGTHDCGRSPMGEVGRHEAMKARTQQKVAEMHKHKALLENASDSGRISKHGNNGRRTRSRKGSTRDTPCGSSMAR